MEKIKTLHPAGKTGVHISKHKYDQVKNAIIGQLLVKGPLTHTELTKLVEHDLKHNFNGSIPWYVEAVKLDLEARKLIVRKHGSKDIYMVSP